MPRLATRLLTLAVAAAWWSFPLSAEALNVDRLDPPDLETLHAILHTLEAPITQKKQDGAANLLT